MRNITITRKEPNGWYDRWKEKHTYRHKVIVSGTNLHDEEVSEEVEIVTYDKIMQISNWIEYRVRWLLRKPEIKTVTGIGFTKTQFK